MKKGRHLTIRQTLWLSMALTGASMVLGAGALCGYQFYRRSQHAERLWVKAIAETYAAQIAPQLLMGTPADIAKTIKELSWHPATCLLAILDTTDELIAVRGHRALLEEYMKVRPRIATETQNQTWHIPGDASRFLPDMNLAAVPIIPSGSSESLGILVCAARPSKDLPAASRQAWILLISLSIMAATGVFLGFWWLRQNVLAPLALLSGRSKSVDEFTAEIVSTSRQDEIGALARLLEDMQIDIDQWRGRAVDLEDSVKLRVAVETHKINRELQKAEKKIWIDPLTRLGNRRLLEEKFEDIFKAQTQASRDLSIVMIDVDNFKILNDTRGHKAGDELLEFVGELLKQCLREQDIAVRYGGDEFILILPDVSARDAQSIAERTLRMFAQQTKLLPVDPQPTISAGIASLWQNRPTTAQQLLKQADQALYEAKESGKSRAAVYNPANHAVLSR